MALGADWPTDEVRDVLARYNLRILRRDRRRTGVAPWWVRGQDGRFLFDPKATWTETHYLLRREVVCESCGQPFGYNFDVVQVSRLHREGRGTDGSLYRELGRQLGRRIRCPHCRTIQKEVRRELLRAERRQTGFACGLLLFGLLIFAGLGLLGGLLAGVWGFFIGLLIALGCMILLWYFALPYIVNMGPVL